MKLREAALDFLFPRWCLGCGREGAYICSSCRSGLPRMMPTVYPVCSNQSAAIDGIRSPFRFEGVIRRAVHELKYRNLRAVSETLAGFLHQYLLQNELPGEVLVPVPLHGRRLRQRGYNQSQLLARELGKLKGLPVEDRCLIRRHPLPPQAESASAEERRANVAAAFSCRDGRLKGERVLLIDDVATSGATLSACAAALKEAGATSVWGLTLAREV